jgi:hypothetical protein
MAKYMPVPNTRTLNVMKTIGNQSVILNISRLLLDTIYCEEHHLKTAASAASFFVQTIVEPNFDHNPRGISGAVIHLAAAVINSR